MTSQPSGCGPGEERCGISRISESHVTIAYCPHHAAAPLLVEALKRVHNWSGDLGGSDWDAIEAALRAAGETI